MGSKASELDEKFGDEVAASPELEAGRLDNVETLPSGRLWLLGSAMVMNWTIGVMQVCGTGFLLPVIQSNLNSSAGQVEWVNSAFNITWGCFALVAGRLGDIYGQRSAYLIGAAWTALWIGISGFMPNVIGLSFARALAGVGFAVATPAASAIVGNNFPEGRPKNMAFAIMLGGGAIGAGIGWLLGGVFASATRYSWRVLPWVITALMLYPLAVGFASIPKSEPHPRDRRIDWLGAVTITASQITLNLGLTFSVSSERGWKTPFVDIPPLLVLGILLFTFFVWRQISLDQKYGEGTATPPLTPRRLFAKGHGQLLALYGSAIFVWAGVDNMAVTGAYLYDQVFLLTGWQSALRVAPAAFSGLLATIFVASTLTILPARILLVICDILGALCGIFFGTRALDTAYWRADLWGWLAQGFATDGTSTIAQIIISNVTEREDQGVAQGIFLSFARFGATLGLSIVTIVRQAVTQQQEDSMRSSLDLSRDATLNWVDEQKAMFEGIRAGFWTGSAFIFAGTAIIAVGFRGWEVVGKKK